MQNKSIAVNGLAKSMESTNIGNHARTSKDKRGKFCPFFIADAVDLLLGHRFFGHTAKCLCLALCTLIVLRACLHH